MMKLNLFGWEMLLCAAWCSSWEIWASYRVSRLRLYPGASSDGVMLVTSVDVYINLILFDVVLSLQRRR